MSQAWTRHLTSATVLLFLLGCYRDTAIEVFPVTATRITPDNTEVLSLGTDSSGRIGDYLLESSNIQVILNGTLSGANRDIHLPKSYGAILDLASRFQQANRSDFRSRDDDGINLLSQGVNMSDQTLVGYDSIRIIQEGQQRASLVLTGGLYDLDGSLERNGARVDSQTRRVSDCEVTTVYSLQDLIEATTEEEEERQVLYLTMNTVVANRGGTSLPIFTVNDIVVTTTATNNIFVPYPEWGFDIPAAGGHAYPSYVHFQPVQANTTHYAYVSRMEGVLMASRAEVPRNSADFTFVGKPATTDQTLAAGGQLTFLRELMVLNSGTEINNGFSSLSAYSSIYALLAESPPPGGTFSETGGLSTTFLVQTFNLPGGRVVLEYIADVNYFNGREFVPLEEGRTLPIFGDSPISTSYTFFFGDEDDQTFLLPTGRMAFSAKALNSLPRYIELGEQIVTDDDGMAVTDEDGNPVTVQTPIVITKDETYSAGTQEVGDQHYDVGFTMRDDQSRGLMGRITVERLSPEEQIETGQLPRGAQGRFLYVNVVPSPSTTSSTGVVIGKLPPGEYEILAGRGPLYPIALLPITIEEGSDPIISQDFDITLPREISFDGYLSADFNVRSSGDFLGAVSQTQLIRFAYAEDIDVLFIADTNHQSIIRDDFTALSLGLAGFDMEDAQNGVASLRDELAIGRATATIGKVAGTSGDRGRFALFNLPGEDDQLYLEAPLFESDAASFYDRVREMGENVVIQVNRPRAPRGLETGFFTAIAALSGLAEGTPIPADNSFYFETSAAGSGTAWIDFDIIQILEGNRYDEYLLARQDWFNLLNEGIFKPASGGSRAGQTRDLPIGSVRAYVAVDNTELRDNDLSEFWEAVKAGAMFVTNGPLIEARIGNTSYGQTTSVSGATFSVNLKISAASWLPVHQVRAVVDGVTRILDLTLNQEGNIRFEGDVTLDLPPGRNGHWVVFEAGASLEALAGGVDDNGLFSRFTPGHLPLAFTNPIFINGSN